MWRGAFLRARDERAGAPPPPRARPSARQATPRQARRCRRPSRSASYSVCEFKTAKSRAFVGGKCAPRAGSHFTRAPPLPLSRNETKKTRGLPRTNAARTSQLPKDLSPEQTHRCSAGRPRRCTRSSCLARPPSRRHRRAPSARPLLLLSSARILAPRRPALQRTEIK